MQVAYKIGTKHQIYEIRLWPKTLTIKDRFYYERRLPCNRQVKYD